MSIVKLNNRGVRSATTFGSISGLGEMRFIKKQTASASSTVSFVDGTSDVVLDDTYKEYLFTWNNIHPQTDDVDFKFQGNAAGGSGYNESITSTWFEAYHDEGDTGTSLAYNTSRDQANGTSFQFLHNKLGNDNDQCAAGYLRLFNPSSTTFVKHFISACTRISENNVTAAIDAVQFKMSSGDIDAGDICLYGIN